jgi:predicted N-acetyltransferase YhbS
MLRELTELSTGSEEQGKGHGSALMREVCEEADKSATVLMLIADSTKLADWYSRFGFQLIQVTPRLMLRSPRQ